MPSSRPNTIPSVIHIVKQLRPASILDIGVGFGKWGHLFREYTDIVAAEQDPKRYRRKNWRVRIDGIEGHAAYLTPMHRFVYNEIHVGDACKLMSRLPQYDLIFLGDIIEHLGKASGRKLLRRCVAKARKAVVLTTPKYETSQTDLCGNELERHRSLWSAADFEEFSGVTVKTIDRDILLVVICRDGKARLNCDPPRAPGRGIVRRLEATRRTLVENIPLDQKFILVDEEQMRHELPHRKALPFLERDGEYWGPPADDETAIREFERLRRAGATSIAFIWPCFWWLEHYQQFRNYLRNHFRAIREDKNVVLFALMPQKRAQAFQK